MGCIFIFCDLALDKIFSGDKSNIYIQYLECRPALLFIFCCIYAKSTASYGNIRKYWRLGNGDILSNTLFFLVEICGITKIPSRCILHAD